MTINEYQQLAARTIKPSLDTNELLEEAVMGLNGEAGEVIDLIKKHKFHGHELDKVHLAKELGDVLWYAAEAASALGWDLDDICTMNIEKLRKRYPEGFSERLSRNRAEGDI